MSSNDAAKTFQQVSEFLLKKHYGLTLNDTPLSEASYVGILIEANVRPFEYLNEHAADCNLNRVDLQAPWGIPSQAGLTEIDEINALALALPAPKASSASRSWRP